MVRSLPIQRIQTVHAYTVDRHNLTDDEKKAYIDAELCLMSSPAKAGIELAQNRWDELSYAHIAQSNFIHRVVSAMLVFVSTQVRYIHSQG